MATALASRAYTVAPSPHIFAFTSLPAFDAHRSLWRMLREALVEARQTQIDREIEAYLATTGGKLTDQVEREIERLSWGNPSRW